MKPILLAGETFAVTSFAAKGGDVGSSWEIRNGARPFIAALNQSGIEVEQLGGERCEAEFPFSAAELDRYSVVVLSDIGASSLLITPETRKGNPGVNRLNVLRDWVQGGGGLIMAGGYCSFQGMDGSARFHRTAVEECLPVECLPYADGIEAPEGLTAEVTDPDHAIVAGLPANWPPVLGMNITVPRHAPGGRYIARVHHRNQIHPLLAARTVGSGRSIAWMTDIGPHWLSSDFLSWPHYADLMVRMVRWAAHEL
ncbi:membrane protein [Devosia epidermidihirudinis]|uniref:Membrane protein n=1 Tax=Devosia epidermidihirudinis TaxID=1293439 RepID=A0A0F5QB85_9HYPH|nr:glutamine amidotransferase [Devosia epidermidihirudinis]KKC37988.1 membrane protein [Devosia epidermidihirudinis]